MLSDVPAQAGFDPWPQAQVHVEWGVPGVRLAAARGDLVVIVDVLSFSTTLAIAVERDITCVVHSGAEIEAMGGYAAAAARYGARPASRDRRVAPGEISLSPASVLAAAFGQRVLFTSLNGAAAVAAAGDAPGVLVGCLRLRLSAEAQCAAAAWSQSTAKRLIADCVSARELVAAGFADDVALALEVDVQSGVPVRQAEQRRFADGATP